ncbi:hypothetical protein G4G28_18245 [Massilia sp. Dwa41.01b]|uniref:XAC2610-related protein n=1 Tax=unclassified Massilia TaxID=2609279 RepID=UPI001601615A|nr:MULTISPECIES: hypothetical protein [unclassified Massilia]QNA89952.1 hypothetical protein G4G28_18245 [Massilia sp. Dwa41.01b]QNB00836.1 hypothetical protein G4G31_21810 [Massilia sp. Se16.2.3]
MWKTLSIAVLCCSSLPAWAADPWCSQRGKPAYRFEWVPEKEADRTRGSVHISDASGKTVQVLANLGNERANSESLDTSRDFNYDGCPDLAVTSDVGDTGNESLTVFLYKPKGRQFELSKALSEIGGLDIDNQHGKCVSGAWNVGEAEYYSSRHCWRQGKLVIDHEYDRTTRVNEDGEFVCMLHVETTYRNGKKRTQTKCTQEPSVLW